MAPIKPYKIAVPDSQLAILKQKLELATFPDELPDAEWDMGSPLADIQRLTKYWKDEFDWRAQEQKLNELPQYTTLVDVPNFGELEVHFVHQPSEVKSAIPLLFIHGWPGSFIEVVKLLPLLTKGDDISPAFHVVAPSLPNFGFSEVVKKRGFGLKQYAQTMNSLMQTLGYSEYVTQGGDWGAFISRAMCQLFPDVVQASHLNLVFTDPPYPWRNPLIFLQSLGIIFSPKDKAKLAHTQKFQTSGSGYLSMQDSKPQTIGYALQDSPVALLAWIYEKLHEWTDSYPWTEDEVCTWISIYQFSRAGPAASVRIYYESTHSSSLTRMDMISNFIPRVPLGLAYLPKELALLPKIWGHKLGPVVQQTEFENGGHFAAIEVPEMLAKDVKKMFAKGGPAFGVVRGKDGY